MESWMSLRYSFLRSATALPIAFSSSSLSRTAPFRVLSRDSQPTTLVGRPTVSDASNLISSAHFSSEFKTTSSPSYKSNQRPILCSFNDIKDESDSSCIILVRLLKDGM
ncbi:hypothetical protein B0H13DRAFT_2070599 [Mycena leptocephala]|nr:hypothetical protein B0H13DRAFT_2070599 [Mycena leptocephala]